MVGHLNIIVDAVEAQAAGHHAGHMRRAVEERPIGREAGYVEGGDAARFVQAGTRQPYRGRRIHACEGRRGRWGRGWVLPRFVHSDEGHKAPEHLGEDGRAINDRRILRGAHGAQRVPLGKEGQTDDRADEHGETQPGQELRLSVHPVNLPVERENGSWHTCHTESQQDALTALLDALAAHGIAVTAEGDRLKIDVIGRRPLVG